MLAVFSLCVSFSTSIRPQLGRRSEAVQMVTSWYDSGSRLAGGKESEYETAAADSRLQRSLLLRTFLPDVAPLSDTAVEALIEQVEADASKNVVVDDKLTGEWRQVWQRTAKEGTTSQKVLSPASQKLYQNFIVDDEGQTIFRNLVQVTKNRVRVVFDVAYDLPDGESSPPRLPSTIKTARLELKLGRRFGWKPLRIPLPLKGEGWLDVTYLSDEMRITRGNRGGVFVHMRDAALMPALARRRGSGHHDVRSSADRRVCK